MVALKNPKHERFCQEYVKDLNATQAYIRAGYAERGANVNSARLMAKDSIKTRIAELQVRVAQRLEITQESVLREIDETRAAAIAAEQHSVALKASELKGKHIGMWPNRIDAKLTFIDELNDAEQRIVEAALAAIARDKGEDAEGPAPTHH